MSKPNPEDERDPSEVPDGIIPDEHDVKYNVFKNGDGEWIGEDEHGNFALDAGTPEPPDPDDYNYEPCGAVLKYTWDRFGERRYCEGMAISNFMSDDGDNDHIDREYPQFCKHHQTRGAIMDHVREEQAKHLTFAASFETLFEYLDAHKQVLAIEMFSSLLEESSYDYDPEYVVKEIDVEQSDLFPGMDTAHVDFPVPTEHKVRAKSLYFAALNYVQMENIMEEQFRVAAQETGPEGEPLSVGERTSIITVTDDGREIEDKEEHHLNLPLSRIQKDYERHLKVGGVETGEYEEVSDAEARQWVFSVEEKQGETQPESTSSDNPMTELDTPDD